MCDRMQMYNIMNSVFKIHFNIILHLRLGLPSKIQYAFLFYDNIQKFV
jgi:hypothetical protein